jgi:3-dehydroquinate synthetase
VIMGMMMATKLSYEKKLCSLDTLNQLKEVYDFNNLKYDIKKFFKKSEYNKIIEYMTADKKNNDRKINLILLKKIGLTTQPNMYKISIIDLKKVFDKII